MAERVRLFLVPCHEDEYLAVAADSVSRLTKTGDHGDGARVYDLLELTGLGSMSRRCSGSTGRVQLVARVNGLDMRLSVPTPTELVEMPLTGLRPVPALLRDIIPVQGLAGFLPLAERLVPVFDPVELASKLCRERI